MDVENRAKPTPVLWVSGPSGPHQAAMPRTRVARSAPHANRSVRPSVGRTDGSGEPARSPCPHPPPHRLLSKLRPSHHEVSVGHLHRRRSRREPRLRLLQRHVRRALLQRDHGRRRGPVRFRQRRRPGRLPRPGQRARPQPQVPAASGHAAHRPPLPQRPAETRSWRRRRRKPPLHRRHRRKPHRSRRLRHGRRHGRLRQRRLDGPVRHELRRQPAAAKPRRRHVRRCHGRLGRRRSPLVRRRHVLRLRPRRLAGPLRRQLRRLLDGGPHAVPPAERRADLLRPRCLPAGGRQPVSQPGRRYLRGRVDSLGNRRRARFGVGAPSPPTSTATAGSTSTWPTT